MTPIMPPTGVLSTATDAVLRPQELPAASPQEWHWPEYGAELAGTAWNIFVGLSAVVFNNAPALPGSRLLPDASLRLWVTGLIFAGSGSLFAISPWGRLSGAHINPSVTLGFWVAGKMRRHDLLGYLTAQFAGGTLGAFALAAVWGPHAAAVRDGITRPGTGYTVSQAFGAEWLMTFLYVAGIFCFVSHQTLVRWTPLMNWLVVSGLVWLGAGISGTSLNPARSFGPALVVGQWHAFWVYLFAPPLGSVMAVWCCRSLLYRRSVITAKLSHSPSYRSIFRHLRSNEPQGA